MIDDLKHLSEKLVFIGLDGWIIQVFIVVLLTVVADFFGRILLRYIAGKLQLSKTLLDDSLFFAARAPLLLIIWSLGLTFAADIVLAETGNPLFKVAEPIRNVSVIAAIAWFLIRLIKEAEKNFIQRIESRDEDEPGLDRTTSEAIGKLLRLAIGITAAIVILQTLGFSVSGVLAFGGIGGIAIGFAARDLLANFFGALMIYLDRPFAVNDWIRSPDRNIEGTVEYIGWRHTRIRTFDKRPLYVPNSIFTNIVVENPSRMLNRRIYETVGVRYDDVGVIEAIISDVKAMLIAHDYINDKLTMIVNFVSFAPSSLDFMVYTFTHTTNWIEFHQIKQDVMLKIAKIIEQHGAEIAYPTSTVHIASANLPSGLTDGPQTTALQHAGANT